VVSDPESSTLIDLPELTTGRLDRLLRGDRKDGGWLGAYPAGDLPLAELTKRLDRWETALDGLLPELWQLFADKLDAALKRRGLKAGARLVWLPTGALGILPLGAAQDPASKRRLVDSYEIVCASSLQALATARQQIAIPTAATLAAIVNPTADLSGTEKEGRLVASHFPAKARTVLERGAARPRPYSPRSRARRTGTSPPMGPSRGRMCASPRS
jgi:hypothetical protein